MPIYEYECSSCHHQFDLIQKISDEPVKECPTCHKDTAIKLISAAGFQLKGTGWYVTDFKNKNSGPPAKQNETTKSTTSPSASDAVKSTKSDAE
jgi:putative FmdB family regulatory protein